MKRLIIKVCGMREPENIRRVEALAPDWMGFICWNGSKRYIGRTPDYLPQTCRRVGVFVNPEMDDVLQQIERLRLDIVQLHGQETPDFCRAIREKTGEAEHPVELIKAFGMTTETLRLTEAFKEVCDYFLFDTPCASGGGSGICFDWRLLREYDGPAPFLLSGGIGPDSVELLSRFSHPRWIGVDLNSRFETAPALKDTESLARFMQTIREL
ncbi:MAG: phosphoribosylanthranilate isomerase [Paraprevotella sp.]|nr:phosphoribosylanthranilate isomerase [Paraprevotella sp.]